jgi:Transglutaminase-like superfamily
VTSRRAMVAGAIVAAWLAGLAMLIRREYYRPPLERLAEAAMRVTPSATYYGVMQGATQIGFASSTIDTAKTSITISDYLVADLPVGGKARRATARTNVTMSRALRMSHFDLAIQSEGAPIVANGRMEGDSALLVTVAPATSSPDTHRIALSGPILLPTVIPLALALSEKPAIGKHYTFPVFDPGTMGPKEIGLDVRAESLFVVNDSSVFDAATQRWRGTRPDTLRAWQVVAGSSGGFSGWVDEQGRIVETSQLGFILRRLPYEVAFENWRSNAAHLAVSEDRDILETTAIAANKRLDRRIRSLRVRLSNVDLGGFDLSAQRQRLSGDTLTIDPEPDAALVATYALPLGFTRDPANTRPEALIQSRDPHIVALAKQIAGSERNPRVVAERINRWVHDSIHDRVTFGVPSALQVLDNRTGDCNEHTQLFVALARALGLPARVAAGLAYVDGKFYYHAWPEVLLGDWVPVDPTFGQFPADAAHLRFVLGGLARQTELLRLMGNLKIEVLAVNGSMRTSSGMK